MRITRKITRKLRASGVLRAKSKITRAKLRENKNKPLPVFQGVFVCLFLDGNSNRPLKVKGRYEVEYTDKVEVIVIEEKKYGDGNFDGLLSDAAKVCIPILLIFF